MSVNIKMTALADGVRTLSGTTTPKGLDAMTADVNAANAEISEQADLIEQIVTALDGKAAGSGVAQVSGTKDIVANGTYDVASYANVNVKVPIPSGFIKPNGTAAITKNGVHGVSNYAYAKVDVPVDLKACSTFTVNIPSDNLTFTLNASGEKMWGDGVIDSSTTHTYARPGVYSIVYTGEGGYGHLFSPNWDVQPSGMNPRVLQVVLSDEITSIGYCAFYGCNNLTSITISDSVTSIGQQAFDHCSNLTNITYTGTTEQWNAIRFGTDWNANTSGFTITCTGGEE